MSSGQASNPLLEEWVLPHRFPPFDKIKPDHFPEAFTAAMSAHLAEIDAIANSPEQPTFDNTLTQLEKSGRLLDQIGNVFGGLCAAFSDDALKAVEAEMAPKLAKHADDISLNPKLYNRIRTLYEKRDTLGLDGESSRLLWQYHQDFVRAGAELGPSDQEALRKLNSELATLNTTFAQYVMKEVSASAVWFDAETDLDGLPPADLKAALDNAGAVDAEKRKGKFLLKLVNTSGQPALKFLKNPMSRRKVMEASLARGSRGGEFDTRALIVSITAKRLQRAKLLGFPHHSGFQLADQTIGGWKQANQLLRDLAPAALANARQEHSKLQQLAADLGDDIPDITVADWDFYSEKIRSRDFKFDEAMLKPYFELHRVFNDGLLYSAEKLYGIKFVLRKDLPVYDPDVKVYDVLEHDGHTLLAIFVVDFFARETKRGGAWMMSYQVQSDLHAQLPIIANHSNIAKPTEGLPALLTVDEVTTLFHEFGHALHGMMSKVRFPRFSGTNVPTDFVEFPSQVNEMWAVFPDVIQNYARHYETGEPIDPELLAKLKASEQFNEGYRTTEYLAASLLDQAYHQLSEPLHSIDDVVPFEQRALKEVGLDFAPVPPRYRSTYFSHIFSSNGYAAKYCGYLWSEVLDAHAAAWMTKNGGLTRANGDKFRSCVLSRGGSADPMSLFESFVGGKPDIKPLLERRGLRVEQ